MSLSISSSIINSEARPVPSLVRWSGSPLNMTSNDGPRDVTTPRRGLKSIRPFAPPQQSSGPDPSLLSAAGTKF